jgi:PilZ domain
MAWAALFGRPEMSTFGKSSGGGRRKTPRAAVPLLAVVSTVAYDRRVGLLNVSRDGVLLTSPDLPAVGETVIFQSETLQSFGRVAWSHDCQCGIEFEAPISQEQVQQLRQEGDLTSELPYLSFSHGRAA